MKKFIIIFVLNFGNIPSYIFTKVFGKKDYLQQPDGEKGEIPAVFHNGIHAISVDHQEMADTIKSDISKFVEAGYGEIKIEIVNKLSESKIWEGVSPLKPEASEKRTTIEFAYTDESLPTSGSTPSVTEEGTLEFLIDKNHRKTFLIEKEKQIEDFLPRIKDSINSLDKYHCEIDEKKLVITTSVETPSFVWCTKTTKHVVITNPANLEYTKDVAYQVITE